MQYEEWAQTEEIAFGNETLNVDKLPVQDWCFDILLFYESVGDKHSIEVLKQLMIYAQFSFIVNGVVTCVLAVFGLTGNALLFYQVHFLLNSLGNATSTEVVSGIISLYYKIIPFVGIVAYILYFFQPFASFCVTGTIWQVSAITIERYMAVSHPLEQQTRKARFSVRWICAAIAVCAFILNMTAVPFERYLKKCYEFLNDGQITIKTMIVQQDIVNNQYFAILVHLIPDLIFRAPSPIILIATLTVRTLQIYKKRRVGSNTIHVHRRRNIPFMLTVSSAFSDDFFCGLLLNVKFILCNTLYMFNTILMEVMGYGGRSRKRLKYYALEFGRFVDSCSSQQTNNETQQYIRSLYLTDFSNMLLALHSATNWLLFYHWRNCTKQPDSQRQSTTSNSALKSAIDPHDAGSLLSRFSPRKQKIGTEIIARLCIESPELARVFIPNSNELTKESFRDNANVQLHGKIVGDFIETILHSLANKSTTLSEVRANCRRIGVEHFRADVHLTAAHWKIARDVLISCCTTSTNKWATQKIHSSSESSLEQSMMRAFNLIVSEIKSGALCASVDLKQSVR
ncbi:unnamed protein product [Toxocara canis]|uniref:GLOBIN domain-containing protein n=1 Tax=Toxocara canis TaxID=6265 RepID=A0A183V0D1_TOXCA|nr:unnamed protein product [Toxocara canis]